MKTRNKVLGAGLLALLPAGCAAVDPRGDYDEAARHIEAATGTAAAYRPGGDEVEATARGEALRRGGLELSEAVELALLNNPALQASYLGIGMSRADLVQAGLLPNPTLGLALRLPSGGGVADLDAELMQEVMGSGRRGARVRAARSALDMAVLAVAEEAVLLAERTRLGYFAALSAKERGGIASESVTVARGLLLVAEAREQAGAGTELEVNVARSELGASQLEERDAELALDEALFDLTCTLGLTRSLAVEELVSPLPGPLDWEAEEEDLVELARTRRLDLEAARHAVDAARARLEVERGGRWPSVEVGLTYERADGQRALGPAAAVTLPVFDRNQARHAKAQLLLEAAEKDLAARELAVRREVLGAYRRGRVEWETASFYRDELLPHDQRSMELSLEAYQESKVSFLSALEAQQRLLTTRRNYVARRLRCAAAGPELERALGVPLAEAMEYCATAQSRRKATIETEAANGDGNDE